MAVSPGNVQTYTLPSAFTTSNQTPLIVLIREVGQGGYMERLLSGAQAMAHEFGVTLVALTADGDQAAMIGLVQQAIDMHAAAIIIDHGQTAQLKLVIEQALAANIKVVASDLVVDHQDVPEIEQDDMLMSFLLCKQLAADYDATATVIYANIDAHLPLIKRDRIWQDFKWRYPGLHEVVRIGAVADSIAAITQQHMDAAIIAHPQANLVIAMWDEFAKGAEQAIINADKAEQIKLYSMDINDYDIQRMTDPASPWVATVATDSSNRGRLAVRVAVALIGGERFKKYLLIEPLLITQAFLIENRITNMATLIAVLPTLGDSAMAWYDWMDPLLARQGYTAPKVGKRAEDALHESEAQLRRAFDQQSQLIETVRALSTPIMPIFDHVLVLPLIGDIDSNRSQQIMESLLQNIMEQQAEIVIIDITGVLLVDTAIANHLLQTTRAAELLGAECILVGISPEVAQTIVQLGVDLRTLKVYSNLQTGIAYALSRRGLTVARSGR